jgi:hypothetical protein
VTWETVETGLNMQLIRQVLDNEIGAIRLSRFIDQDACQRSRSVLEQAPYWSFYEGTIPPLGRLGITLYEHFGAKEDYLVKAGPAMDTRRRLMQGLPDPMEMLLELLNAEWPGGARLATERDRPYFAGVFRRGTSNTIHCDWAPRDAPGWEIGSVRAQLGWNLYYDMPDNGGELLVFNFPWEPYLEAHARQRFNDYDPQLFKDSQKVIVRPGSGDLVLFNSKNAHAVGRSPQGYRRLSVGSFIGEMPTHELVFWS